VGLLEIGPGRGALTLPFLTRLSGEPQIRSFILSEKDPHLVQDWVEELGGRTGVEVQAGDFLDLSVSQWLKINPTIVVSNLPYASGTAILQRLIEVEASSSPRQISHRPQIPAQIPVMILMFQAEVAERLRAEPSTSARGSLSVWVQNLWEVKKLRIVGQKSFSPPPKVMSEVVVLRRRSAPLVAGSLEEGQAKLWQTLLQICFSQRRKMLRGLLKSHSTWQKALELSRVDGTKRAEALDWTEWNRLFQAGVQL
jgi:16S rRNA (adenine1518-N6/adenine1519-N6)-dimethyltransferase